MTTSARAGGIGFCAAHSSRAPISKPLACGRSTPIWSEASKFTGSATLERRAVLADAERRDAPRQLIYGAPVARRAELDSRDNRVIRIVREGESPADGSARRSADGAVRRVQSKDRVGPRSRRQKHAAGQTSATSFLFLITPEVLWELVGSRHRSHDAAAIGREGRLRGKPRVARASGEINGELDRGRKARRQRARGNRQ